MRVKKNVNVRLVEEAVMEAVSARQYAGYTDRLQFQNWDNNRKGLQTFEGSRVRRGRRQGLSVLENGGAHAEETPGNTLSR